MNRIKHNIARGLLVTTFLAVVTLSVGSCGGGGGGGMQPPAPPPPVSGPTLAITVANAQDVASTVVVAMGIGFNLGGITAGDLSSQAAGAPPEVLQLTRMDDLVAKPLSTGGQKQEPCASGGTVDITAVVADPNALSVGDRITAIFANCDDNAGYVISGRMDMTVAAIDGDFMTEVFLLGLDVVLTNIEITEGAETVTADGGFTLTLDSLDYPLIVVSMAGNELQFGTENEELTLTDFDHAIEVDSGIVPATALVEVLGTVDSQRLGGSVDYETPVSLQAIEGEAPYTGEILVTGAESSTVRIVINDSTSITLECDTNGDGIVDEFIDTTWAALDGQTAM